MRNDPYRYLIRDYISEQDPDGLVCYEVSEGESLLFICTIVDTSGYARELLAREREQLASYMRKHPRFEGSFRPLPATTDAPAIVRKMCAAAEAFDVGPMAAVAGAISQCVGMGLLPSSPEVIVENGGDLFLAGSGSRKVRIFCGYERPSLVVTVGVRPEGVGLCTSSGTVGPSASLGNADAVTVLAGSAETADAAATAVANRVREAQDIKHALEYGASFDEILGLVIAVDGQVGLYGDISVA